MKTSAYIALAIVCLSVLSTTGLLTLKGGSANPQPVTQAATNPSIDINWGEGVDVHGISSRERTQDTQLAQK